MRPDFLDYGTPTIKLQVSITLYRWLMESLNSLFNVFDEFLPMCYYVSIFLFVLLGV
jgi:hypothetical protein